MHKVAEFVAPDPQIAMAQFNTRLRQAMNVSPGKLEERVRQDNLQREARRVETGQAKRGPKPKA
jgi:hypothetical protein